MKAESGHYLSSRAFTQGILFFEALGFALIVALLWLNECLDLPHHLFGAAPTPINWPESLLESVLVLGLAGGTLAWTDHALARIRYLEGFLQVCAFCRKVRSDDKWISIEEYVAGHSELAFSPGLCPECLKRYFPECVDR